MAAPQFGENVDISQLIRDVLQRAPALCTTDAQILMRDRYETGFGIYNHDIDDPDRPLALVGMHWAEDGTSGSLLYERIELHVERQVFKWTGLSLEKFLELPTDLVMKVLEECHKRQKVETTTTTNILSQLDTNNPLPS